MRIESGSAIDRAIIRLYFDTDFGGFLGNTNAIAKKMDIPEYKIERIIARERERRWKKVA